VVMSETIKEGVAWLELQINLFPVASENSNCACGLWGDHEYECSEALMRFAFPPHSDVRIYQTLVRLNNAIHTHVKDEYCNFEVCPYDSIIMKLRTRVKESGRRWLV